MRKKETRLTKIENKIDQLRYEMICIGKHLGLNHPKTIKCSQELDELLNKHSRFKSH